MLMLCATTTYAQWTSGRPDGHAPIQIMGDHTHKKGEVMLSYRFMYMNMNGNGDGTKELSNSEVLRPDGPYMVTPEAMPMQMHMLGAMYAVSDDLTLMVMFNYAFISMDHMMMNGNTFTTESSGLGDIKLSGMYNVFAKGNTRGHAQLGISIPTGSLEAKDVTPMSSGNEVILPYPMQLGSGTWDLLPAFTYLGQTPRVSYGAQANGVIRLGENDRGYTFGNTCALVGWTGYKLTDWVSPMLSVKYSSWRDISGKDTAHDMALMNNMVHTVDPDLKAGSKIDLGMALNFQGPEGPLHDLRFGANFDLPVYQNLDGPQMLNKGILTFGLQYTIH